MLCISRIRDFRLLPVIIAGALLAGCAAGTQHMTPAGIAPASLQQNVGGASATRGIFANGNGAIVYDSIPQPLSSDIASVGFECCQVLEFGDGLNLTHTGILNRVSVVLDSWGCQSGNWSTGNCVTQGDPTFDVPITLNVYALDKTPRHVSALLATLTKTFQIEYRPSTDPVRCPKIGGSGFHETYYNEVDKACVHGLANKIVFDFNNQPAVNLPSQIVLGVAYNTTHGGYHPVGEGAACFHSAGGCGYDSLNVSANGNGGPVGSVYDETADFIAYNPAFVSFYCNPALGPGFREDSGCTPGNDWTGFHPQFEVKVK